LLDIDAINDGKMQILTAVPLENKKVLFGITLVIMAALCNRAGHYIFVLCFLSIFYLSFFYSSPNLSGRRLDVYHTSTHGVALVRI